MSAQRDEGPPDIVAAARARGSRKGQQSITGKATFKSIREVGFAMSAGRGKAQKNLDLIAAAVRIFEEIHPASIRACCYRLFVQGLIPSMDKKHTARVSVQLTDAREAGDLPWDFVVDETRRPETIATWDTPGEIISQTITDYRKNYWKEQPAWIEVWSEKGTVRGTLAPVLDKYGVTFRVLHGFSSATVVHDVAKMTEDADTRLTVLYVGDWDPSGMRMSERDIPERLDRYGGQADVRRIAIAREDTTAEANVPSFPASDKTKDPRHRWFVENYGHKCWELDALSPVILRDRVEQEICSRLDLDAWNHSIRIEAAERKSMKKFLDGYKRRKSISALVQKYSADAP